MVVNFLRSESSLSPYLIGSSAVPYYRNAARITALGYKKPALTGVFGLQNIRAKRVPCCRRPSRRPSEVWVPQRHNNNRYRLSTVRRLRKKTCAKMSREAHSLLPQIFAKAARSLSAAATISVP
jgi:hypothetical protein